MTSIYEESLQWKKITTDYFLSWICRCFGGDHWLLNRLPKFRKYFTLTNSMFHVICFVSTLNYFTGRTHALISAQMAFVNFRQSIDSLRNLNNLSGALTDCQRALHWSINSVLHWEFIGVGPAGCAISLYFAQKIDMCLQQFLKHYIWYSIDYISISLTDRDWIELSSKVGARLNVSWITWYFPSIYSISYEKRS